MFQETQTAPSNSLILVMDQTIGVVPETTKGKLVAATDSCVSVGTLCEVDGETLISLSDAIMATTQELSLVFVGVLRTPSKRLSVCSVLNKILLSMNVPAQQTRVQIWANHSTEPDEIRIVCQLDE